MSKGDHRRNPAYAMPQRDFADKVASTLECSEGGWHTRDDEGRCTKCGDETRTPELPPGLSEHVPA